MRAYERFLNYVPVWTTSDETSDTVPSADRELVLARNACRRDERSWNRRCKSGRTRDMYMDTIPATPGCEDKPSLGLVAHMDTVQMHQGKI